MKIINKFLITVTMSSCLSFFGCGDGSEELDRKMNDFSYSNLNKNSNYKWEAKSFVNKNNTLAAFKRKDLTMEGNAFLISVKSGTGDGSRSNLSCSNFGMTSGATGIEIDVSCNENLKSAGIQWWEPGMGAEKFYWIYFTKDGSFTVHETTKKGVEKGLKTFKALESGVNINGMNTIKTYLDDSGNMNIYLNGKLMYKIESQNLMFKKGNFFIVYQSIPNQTYTTQNEGKAKFVLKAEQIQK